MREPAHILNITMMPFVEVQIWTTWNQLLSAFPSYPCPKVGYGLPAGRQLPEATFLVRS
jgi:hypothetical protein